MEKPKVNSDMQGLIDLEKRIAPINAYIEVAKISSGNKKLLYDVHPHLKSLLAEVSTLTKALDKQLATERFRDDFRRSFRDGFNR